MAYAIFTLIITKWAGEIRMAYVIFTPWVVLKGRGLKYAGGGKIGLGHFTPGGGGGKNGLEGVRMA